MKRLSLITGTVIALTAFTAFSAPAFADDAPRFPSPECDGDPYNNDFGLRGLTITSIDSNVSGEVSAIQSTGVACGTFIGGNGVRHLLPPEYHPPVGQDTLNNNARINTPPGIEINPTNPEGNPDVNVGRYVGKVDIAGIAAWGPFGMGVLFPDFPDSVMRVDRLSDCERENKILVGGAVQGKIISCYRVDGVLAGVISIYNWIWTVDLGSGNYTLVVGPLFYNSTPWVIVDSGLTKIENFTICGYAGDMGDIGQDGECGDGSQPDLWIQKNGNPSAPNCDNGNGIYTAKLYNQSGDISPQAEACIEWVAPDVPDTVDPACNPHNNRLSTYDFDIDTPITYRDHGMSSLTGEFLACGTAVNRSEDTYEENGSGSQFVRFDIEAPPGVWARGFGTYPGAYFTDFYAGNADVNLITWSGSPTSSTVFQPNTQLELGVDTGTTNDCPVDATTCYRMQTTGSGVSAHGSVWVTEDSGIYTWTIGELYNDSTSSPVGISKVNSILFCRSVNYPDRGGCDNGTNRVPQRNGDISTPDCNGGARPEGIYTLTGTNRDGQVTAPSKTCIAWYKSPPKCKRNGRRKCGKPPRPRKRW